MKLLLQYSFLTLIVFPLPSHGEDQKLQEPTPKQESVPLADNHNLFRAYDCSQPYDVKRVGHVADVYCQTASSKIKEQHDKSYQLLQLERYQKFSGWSCKAKLSRTITHCGYQDHETTFTAGSAHNEPQVISAADCEFWIMKQSYMDNRGIEHKLTLNMINNVQYHAAG